MIIALWVQQKRAAAKAAEGLPSPHNSVKIHI
jgi:hypothetical protein